jgi:hypothetical protein
MTMNGNEAARDIHDNLFDEKPIKGNNGIIPQLTQICI